MSAHERAIRAGQIGLILVGIAALALFACSSYVGPEEWRNCPLADQQWVPMQTGDTLYGCNRWYIEITDSTPPPEPEVKP